MTNKTDIQATQNSFDHIEQLVGMLCLAMGWADDGSITWTPHEVKQVAKELSELVVESKDTITAALTLAEQICSGDYVLVPKEPTEEMISKRDFRVKESVATDMYKAMIAARPPIAGSEEG